MDPFGNLPAYSLVGGTPELPTRVMSPSQHYVGALYPTSSSSGTATPWTSSSGMAGGGCGGRGTWVIQTCRACSDIMTGPSITCTSCIAAVHAHCATRRMGQVVCTVCAQELDFQIQNHSLQSRLHMANVGLGRIMGASGQFAGQAIGAVASGAVGGAARLVTGCASGAVAAFQGLRAAEMPPATPAGPTRPRQLEECDISDAGSGAPPRIPT